MRKGVPSGYRHDWSYKGHWKETKTRPGKWKFTFTATKNRHATNEGNFGIGTTGAWYIQGIQYIKKTGKGTYQTKLIGTKKPLRFNVKRPRQYRRYRK